METLGDWVSVAPWKSRLLLLIRTSDGTQANTLGAKRDMLRNPGDSLIAVWAGQWSTTARRFAADDPEKVAAILG